MRIQVLPLPHVVLGEAVERPFALIVDQYDGKTDPDTVAQWSKFREHCGARAIAFHSETVDVVDQHASCDPLAVREFGRLDDFLLMNFDDEPGVYDDNDSAVDVAIRLLKQELLRRGSAPIGETP